MKRNHSHHPELQRNPLAINIRAFVPPPRAKTYTRKARTQLHHQSDWTLVFDTETKTDAAQALRFGVYRLYNGNLLNEAGLFFDPDVMLKTEQRLLRTHAAAHGLKLMTTARFIDDVFYSIAYELRATIVGFNLPFDLSRLAIRHGSARGRTMRGGFTFQLSSDPWKPRVQIKHLSARAALIQFTKPRRRFDPRGMRKKGLTVSPRRGAFIDVKTIAAAHTSRSFSLGALAEFLDTKHRKHSTDEHGGPLTEAYVAYAVEDVRVTWECYRKLVDKFHSYGLEQTRVSQILSEASLGKACLREMGILPWREMQPDAPDRLIGIIMSTYYGGRSEVHLRRTMTQVLYCDFLSMYPTVCTLMNLWRFVISKGMTWRDSTRSVSRFLKRVTLPDLQRPDTWVGLTTIVQVLPEDDVLPVRARYADESQATIGLNHLKSKTPLWFTLADCIAAKLLTGKCVKVARALTFEPDDSQDNLKPINIAGNPNYRIDPYSDDFYRSVIDMRSEIKGKLKVAAKSETNKLDSEQQSLKILANATSYGIFVELIVEKFDDRQKRSCYGPYGKPFPIMATKGEEPGRYFHPLLATLITGAARLMLAISETLAVKNGLDWAFCDTDSMALAKPDAMNSAEFISKAKSVCEWFTPLNPYKYKGPLFKIEDANYGLKRGKRTDEIRPLYCFAVSAKRYVLFNLSAHGKPVIRKATAHGLGHLRPPYNEADAPATIPPPPVGLGEIGVERWEYDLWYQIICAALEGHPDRVDLNYHPSLERPAASRYGATTPDLLRWFKTYNQNRLYRDQVKPFNFLLAYQASPMVLSDQESAPNMPGRRNYRRIQPALKPIAPYDSNSSKAAKKCFDRETGELIPSRKLKSYREALAQYHLHPESKFLNGEPFDQGSTRKRHVEAIAVHHIGKEANRWEEQLYLGADEDEQIDYGVSPYDSKQFLGNLSAELKAAGQRNIASASGVSRRTVSRVAQGKRVRKEIVARILSVLQARKA